jgi:hypothetical protein
MGAARREGQAQRRIGVPAAILHLRRVASRYDKLAGNFLAGVILAATAIWSIELALGRERTFGSSKPSVIAALSGDGVRDNHGVALENRRGYKLLRVRGAARLTPTNAALRGRNRG